MHYTGKYDLDETLFVYIHGSSINKEFKCNSLHFHLGCIFPIVKYDNNKFICTKGQLYA